MDRETLDGMFDLSGRVAVITGGTRGIGLAMAAANLCSRGVKALGVPTHMGDLTAIEALVTTTVERYGRLDIVVNNAANALTQPIGAFTPEGFQKSFDVNVRGPVFLSQYALPHLIASGHGSIINMVSAGAYLFSEHVAMYAAGKAAIASFTKSFAAACAPMNVRVNAIAPGPIDTDMVRNNPPEFQQAMADSTLLRRIAHADEVVPTALLLASDAGSYITGQTFSVDGGLVPR